MFYGSEFIFDGRSCREYGLMIYDFGSTGQGDNTDFAIGKAIEDRVTSRHDSFFYGIEQDKPLEFKLVFGVDPDFVSEGAPFDRYEIEDIASWLTGHQALKWLSIVQPDMMDFRYKCYISELSLLSHASLPWAFSCTVTCDSRYAYTLPKTYEYIIPGAKNITFFNRSTHNGYFYPKMFIRAKNGGDIQIVNKTDSESRMLILRNLPANTHIEIDNQNQVLTDLSGSKNYYQHFNFNYLRLLRGNNELNIEGDCTIILSCEFPVIIGG